MHFDIGLAPIFSLLILTLVFSILSDFLLEFFSVRMSLSTGRFQAWMFDRFGQNLFADFIFSILFQFFSLRKKSFFLQMSSLVNVGSFTKRQVLVLSLGSFVGLGASVTLFMGGSLAVVGLLVLMSLLLGLFPRDQIKDFSLGVVALGLFLVSLHFFSVYLSQSSYSIHQFHLQPTLVFILVAMTTFFFRTPVGLIAILTLVYYFLNFDTQWLPAFFFINSLLSHSRFYYKVLSGQNRLLFFLKTVVSFQTLQFAISLMLMPPFLSYIGSLDFLSVEKTFLNGFHAVLLAYAFYHVVPLVLLTPVVFVGSLLKIFDETEKKAGSQKIIFDNSRGSCFSIHLSLFLLRQEFKKYTASVHTLFKMSRENDDGEEEINQKSVRYQGMLNRVGDELKELCFSIGRQRSYRWQVKEVMSYYRYVNQLELLVEDLSYVAALLRQVDQDEEWEKDCRFWLGLQLKLFESFLNFNLGVGKDDPSKVKANMEKSYELLDRFFGENQNPILEKHSSQTFYRMTESIGNLAL